MPPTTLWGYNGTYPGPTFDVDSNASGGFTLAGGYRFLPWLAGEAHFIFLGGNDNIEVGNREFDSEGFAFTFGPKVYPMAFFQQDAPIPEWVQPYGMIGIGGGQLEVDGFDEEDSFVARFILGIDFWLNDHLGAFVEGGGYAVEEDAVGLIVSDDAAGDDEAAQHHGKFLGDTERPVHADRPRGRPCFAQ